MKSKLYKYLKFRYILLFTLLLIVLWRNRPVIAIARPASQSIAAVEGNIMTDPGDGQTYKVVKLADGKLWMAENLRYKPWGGG